MSRECILSRLCDILTLVKVAWWWMQCGTTAGFLIRDNVCGALCLL
jgi:hypothetical protein